MAKKTYSIEWQGCAEVIIEIDHDVLTNEELHQINNFWMDGEDYLEYAEGDIVIAVLKRLARQCFYLVTVSDFGRNYLVEQFDTMEGWPKMDGSMGIRIIGCDSIEIDHYDMSVSEVENHDEK